MYLVIIKFINKNESFMKKLFLFFCFLSGWFVYINASPPTVINTKNTEKQEFTPASANIVSYTVKDNNLQSLNFNLGELTSMETTTFAGADEMVNSVSLNSFSFSTPTIWKSNQLSCVQTSNIWTLTPNGNGGSYNLKHPLFSINDFTGNNVFASNQHNLKGSFMIMKHPLFSNDFIGIAKTKRVCTESNMHMVKQKISKSNIIS